MLSEGNSNHRGPWFPECSWGIKAEHKTLLTVVVFPGPAFILNGGSMPTSLVVEEEAMVTGHISLEYVERFCSHGQAVAQTQAELSCLALDFPDKNREENDRCPGPSVAGSLVPLEAGVQILSWLQWALNP